MDPTFDRVHVVSDLHLGGRPGFQIFNQGAALAGVIDSVAQADSERSVALVLNGDIVDFLAEEPAAYRDPGGAVSKLERIAADPAFSAVWDALGRFAAKPNRTLVLVLGNHDVELALPAVREWVLRRLSGSPEARARVVFAVDGAGF